MNDGNKVLWEPKKASELLGVTEETLCNWRSKEIGPNYVKIGGKVMYLLSDLYLFIEVNHVNVSGE